MKRRITVTVDEDIVDAMSSLDAASLSAAVNAALREKVQAELHRRAALDWLRELDDAHGDATREQRTDIDSYLDEIGFGRSDSAPRATGVA